MLFGVDFFRFFSTGLKDLEPLIPLNPLRALFLFKISKLERILESFRETSESFREYT